jgi:hypothetical protein
MNPLDIGLRLILLVWVYFELLGYLWGGGFPSSLNEIYVVAPAIALLLGVFLPNGFLAKRAGAVIFALVALVAVVRSVHQAQIDLSLPNHGDSGAAMSRAITVVLILLVVAKMVYLYRKRTRSIASSSQNVSGSGG